LTTSSEGQINIAEDDELFPLGYHAKWSA